LTESWVKLAGAIDALVFSSVWLAAAAGGLLALASWAMGIETRPAAVGLAASGTLLVYNLDRLRDLERDRTTAPRRSDFVAAHHGSLVGLATAGAAAAAAFGLAAPRAAIVLLPILCLGLFHRRLKRFENAKTLYITASWLGVVVGLPWALDPSASQIPWVVGILGCALMANAIASNVRDHEAAAARIGPRRALRIARLVAGAGVACACVAPGPARFAGGVPLATFAALLAFRPTERYGLIVVDGALVLGALLGLVSFALVDA
jgi:4-hydroxybenzoate polyprenyltransferase